MRSLISAYERHLQHVAKHTAPSELMRTTTWASFPWLGAGLAIVVACEVFGLSPQLRTWLALFATLVAAGGLYPAWRIAVYRLQVDRAPRAAPWVETANGQLLIQALRRITLNALSHVTLDTRLKRDLWLTSADVSMLLTVLVDECNLDTAALKRTGDGELTIQALLDGMGAATPSK